MSFFAPETLPRKQIPTSLLNMMTRQGGATSWSKSHNFNFEGDKFALLHLSRNLEPDPTTQDSRNHHTPPLHLATPHHLPHINKFPQRIPRPKLELQSTTPTTKTLGQRPKHMLPSSADFSQDNDEYHALHTRKLHNGVDSSKMLYRSSRNLVPTNQYPEPGKKRNVAQSASQRNLPASNADICHLHHGEPYAPLPLSP